MSQAAEMRKIADEFLVHARMLGSRPGLVGFGAREQPLIEICLRSAKAMDAVAAALSREGK